MWGYLYPDTDATGTVQGLATPTPPQAKIPQKKECGDFSTLFSCTLGRAVRQQTHNLPYTGSTPVGCILIK